MTIKSYIRGVGSFEASGEPIYVAHDADSHTCEKARQRLEQTLNDITETAYELTGVPE